MLLAIYGPLILQVSELLQNGLNSIAEDYDFIIFRIKSLHLLLLLISHHHVILKEIHVCGYHNYCIMVHASIR